MVALKIIGVLLSLYDFLFGVDLSVRLAASRPATCSRSQKTNRRSAFWQLSWCSPHQPADPIELEQAFSGACRWRGFLQTRPFGSPRWRANTGTGIVWSLRSVLWQCEDVKMDVACFPLLTFLPSFVEHKHPAQKWCVIHDAVGGGCGGMIS